MTVPNLQCRPAHQGVSSGAEGDMKTTWRNPKRRNPSLPTENKLKQQATSQASAQAGSQIVVDPDSPTAWMAEGNCRLYAPAVFFPSDGVGVDKARKICASCPVKDPCLEHALEFRIEHGVWGGASERARRRLLKDRRHELHTTATQH